VASVWPLYHEGLIDGVLQRWLSFWKVLPSPQRNSIRVTILTKALLPRFTQFGLWSNDQWKQDAPELNFESHSKGLNTYSNKIIQKKCFHIVIMGYCVQIDEEKLVFSPF
jgi:hypothetical protein